MNYEKLFDDFVIYAREECLPLEGIALADEKTVIKECHFTPDLARNIYSHTKSYVATCVGIAIGEGKITLDDRLIDYFPDYPVQGFEGIKLRHLLTMSSGFDKAYLMNADRRAGVGAPDYMKYMLSRPLLRAPGEKFQYSSADSILALRMTEKAVGARLGEYMYEKLLKPMDMGYPLWEHDPQGHPNGGGGMYLRLTEMLKIGQLYLAGGKWRGERLVDAAWIHEATKKQIETGGEEDVWRCGYGYQFWLSPYEGAYRADGAYGQITTVLPKAGMLVAVQCPEVGDFGVVKKALHERFLSLM